MQIPRGEMQQGPSTVEHGWNFRCVQGNEGWRGRDRSTSGEPVTRGFSMRLDPFRAQPALGGGGPADAPLTPLTQERPVIHSPYYLPIGHSTQRPTCHLAHTLECAVMTRRVGSQDTPLLGSSPQTHPA